MSFQNFLNERTKKRAEESEEPEEETVSDKLSDKVSDKPLDKKVVGEFKKISTDTASVTHRLNTVMESPKVLTKDDVFDYIKSQSGKWAGHATLMAVIKRHKAKSTSVIDAIIDIHRHFKDCL